MMAYKKFWILDFRFCIRDPKLLLYQTDNIEGERDKQMMWWLRYWTHMANSGLSLGSDGLKITSGMSA